MEDLVRTALSRPLRRFGPRPLVPEIQLLARTAQKTWLDAMATSVAVATLGLAAGPPWLFASLGPTALLQAQPFAGPTARHGMPASAIPARCSRDGSA